MADNKNPNIINEDSLPNNLTPVDQPPIIPGQSVPPQAFGIDPYGSGPLPQNLGLQPALVKTGAPPSVASIGLFPIAGSAAENAKTIGIVDNAIANIPSTSTTTVITNTTTFDPSDASIAFWRDDFLYGTQTGNTTAGTSTLGELRWDSVYSGAGFPGGNPFARVQGSVYHPGMIMISSGTTANTSSTIFNPFGSTVLSGSFPSSGGNFQAGLPLLDNPGWKMTYIFGFPANRFITSGSSFPLTKTSFYCGLTTCIADDTFSPSGVNNRPPYFVGVRFDTDPGVILTLTSVNTTSGGATIYNGTITGGTSNAYSGVTFTIAGFTNGANNGTFVCAASSGSTLELINTGGVAETHAATATSPSIADTTFKFEMVSNYNINNSRNNLQGTVIDTGITPSELAFYRLDMECLASGSVTLTLSNGTTQSTTTFDPVLTTTCTSSNGSGELSIELDRDNGLGQIVQSAAYTTGVVISSNLAFTIGSLVAIIPTAAPIFFMGIWRIIGTPGNGTNYTFQLTGASSFNPDTQAVLSGYPGLMPYFSWGNDSESSPASKQIALDFFSLYLNPALAGLTENTNYPRFYYQT